MPEQLLFTFSGAAAVPEEPSDFAARERALDATRSFIVQAPAGSGKTELLIQRFLTLLAHASAPEAVVAITFTIKAAAEMRERVLEALMSALGPEPEKAHELRTWKLAVAVLQQDRKQKWSLLQSPSRMRIQTIDALCMSIVRQMPWTARMGAMPDVTEDARRLYERAAEATIRLLVEESRDGRAVETLLRHLDYDASSARTLLASMLEMRDHWLPVIGMQPDLPEVRRMLESSLAAVVTEGLEHLRSTLIDPEARELVELARYAANNLDPEHEVSCCRDIKTLPRDIATWRALASLLITTAGDWRKSPNKTVGFPSRDKAKDRFERLLDRFRSNLPLKSAIDAMLRLPDPAYPEAQWNVLSALFTVLPRAVAELQVIFGERGTVDFTQISQAALHALGTPEDPTDLALVMGHRIEHLLIDEFQDTSRAQESLLRKLTAGWDPGDGRTLFVVGDPMQSIYRFRQADVGLFLSIRETGLENLALEPVTLSANFRSARNLVEWVNDSFSGAFPSQENATVGAVPYSASEAFRPTENAPGIIVHPLPKGDETAETAWVVRLVEEAQNSGESVAVLVRARTHLLETAAQLRDRGIRFRAIEIDSLGARAVVQDLLALTRALLHRADRPSWLAILRAPWCGLTLADLEAIARDPSQMIWESANSPELTLSEDGSVRLNRLKPVVASALERRGLMPLRRLVEGVWVSLGGPACLAGDADLTDAAAYLDLLENEESGGDLQDLEDFIRRVGDLFASPDPAAPDTLELMTIHKAKGLEFDRVIIPGLSRGPKKDDPRLLLWSERPNGDVILAPMSPRKGDRDPIYRFLECEERAKAKHETVRLLYVACTRARRELHLIGHAPCDSGSFLEVLWPVLKEQYGAEVVEAAQSETARQPPPFRRLPIEEAGERTVAPAFPSIPSDRASTGEAPTPPSTENATGTVIHQFLERIATEGVGLWSADRVRASGLQIEFALKAENVPAIDLAASVERVQQALERTLTDERGRWILSTHPEAQSEYAVTTMLNGSFVHLQIDRTFVDEAGTQWIIDFKTGAEIPEQHWAQLERYAEVLREFGGGRPIRKALYFPVTSTWVPD